MTPVEFLPYLKLMAVGYRYTKDDSPDHKWYRIRTDDILAIDHPENLQLICLGTGRHWREWLWNLVFISKEWLNMGRVHGGFMRNVIKLLGSRLNPNSLINHCLQATLEGKGIVIVGHSRGYAIACLVASYLAYVGVPESSIRIVGCGGARVGNKEFNKKFNTIFEGQCFVLNGRLDPVRTQPFWGHTNGKQTLIDIGVKHLLPNYIKKVTEISDAK